MLRIKGKDSTAPTSGGLQIVKNDKFYGRLISRETSAANNSCRVYYGVAAGAVPFVWESQPGTPKNPISSTAIPPLTPPPSYLFKPKKVPTKRHRHSKSNLFLTMMPKLGFNKKSPVLSTPSSTTSSSSSSSSSWSSVPSSPPPSSSSRSLSYNHGRSRFSSPRSSFSSRGGEEDHQDHQLDHDRSPTSTLCFGVFAGRQSSGARLRGCYSMVIMKSALSSIIRSHGSAQGAA